MNDFVREIASGSEMTIYARLKDFQTEFRTVRNRKITEPSRV